MATSTDDQPFGDQTHKQQTQPNPLKATKTSTTWVLLITFFVIVLGLTIFTVQNSKSVEVSYLGWTGTMPLSAAMLFSVVIGGLLAALAGTARVLQLRRSVKNNR